jgi:hypothetical protein
MLTMPASSRLRTAAERRRLGKRIEKLLSDRWKDGTRAPGHA